MFAQLFADEHQKAVVVYFRQVCYLNLAGVELSRCAAATNNRDSARAAAANKSGFGHDAVHAVYDEIKGFVEGRGFGGTMKKFGAGAYFAVGVDGADAVGKYAGFGLADGVKDGV